MNKKEILYYVNKLQEAELPLSQKEIYKEQIRNLLSENFQPVSPLDKRLNELTDRISTKDKINPFYRAAEFCGDNKRVFLLSAGDEYERLMKEGKYSETDCIVQALILAS